MQLTTEDGPIDVEARDGVIRARGLPYGRAARFDVAVPPEPWTGRRDAHAPGPACPQRPGRLDFVTGPVLDGLEISEDCLVLSVTAPEGADGLPVMVWFHGGAYVAGGGESSKYDPTMLAAEGDVVVVTVTYRLGIFGYLAPPGADADDNLGLRDQILALQWVQRSIGAFGGNPSNVTIFGQSAGADSVLALIVSDGTAGLFHRAIVQSAPVGVGTGTVDVAEARADMASAMQAAMARALNGEDPRTTTVARLLEAEAAAVEAAQASKLVSGMAFAPRLGRSPMPAASQLEERLADAAQRVELFIGHTADDAAPFVFMNPRVAALGRVRLLQQLVVRSATGRMTRRTFGSAVGRFADDWTANGGQVATYRFEWAPADAPFGSCHCMELPFLLGVGGAWSDAPMLGRSRTIDAMLARRMRSVWAGFARDGIGSLPTRTMRFT
ncbi:carboxylesterase family protein [Mycobacterium sp. URHB0044]|uniref:carboxylesterase family protein n=1 Tax=Mycobacterium sp. URHB0044 TaxID=1380386 RepID=UPI00048CFC0A|nr:carboxylesterase family protein [Mycobacterium sp. URHB0044]